MIDEFLHGVLSNLATWFLWWCGMVYPPKLSNITWAEAIQWTSILFIIEDQRSKSRSFICRPPFCPLNTGLCSHRLDALPYIHSNEYTNIYLKTQSRGSVVATLAVEEYLIYWKWNIYTHKTTCYTLTPRNGDKWWCIWPVSFLLLLI